jgi:glycosyltransferase involved in cell wall biosynthesis
VNVAHVTLSFERGGRREAICNLAKGLQGHGIDSSLVVLDHFGCPEEILREHFAASIALNRSGAWDRSAWGLLRAFCQQHQIDVLHTHDAASLFAAAGATFGGGTRPLIMTFHRSRPLETATLRDRIRNALVLLRCQAVVTVSSERREHFAAENFVPAAKLLTVPLGVSLERFRFDATSRAAIRNEIGCGEGTAMIGAVGHFGPEKGLDVVIDACAELDRRAPSLDWRLVIVGSGDSESQRRIERHASALPAERITFAGFREDIHRWFSAFDLFAHGAREEAFGLVLVESMAASRPVVAAGVGGVVDIVRQNETGILVPVEDPAAMATALRRLIEDRSALERMGAASRARAESEYRLETFARRHAQIYAALLAGRRRFDDLDLDA